MKRIDLLAALSACADDIVRQKIAHKVGLPASSVAQVLTSSGSIVIAALAARASEGRDETIAVFGALMARNINPRIRDECVALVDSTSKLKELEHAGFTLIAHATGNDATLLSDHIAAQIGMPAQATCALACVCAAIVGGLIKHHVLIEQGDVSELPSLFAGQLATIADHLDEGSIDALGYLQADLNAFLDQVSVRLAAVTADFEPVRPRVGEPVKPAQEQAQSQPSIAPHNRYEIGKVFVNDIRFTSTMHPSPIGPAGALATREKPKSRRTWKVFALTTATVLVAVLAWAKAYQWPQVQSAFAQVTNEAPPSQSTTSASGVISSPGATADSKK